MKSAALRAALDDLAQRADTAHRAYVTPLSESKWRLEAEHGVRVWGLDLDCELRFAFADIPYSGGFTLQSRGRGVNSPVLTAAGLRRGAMAIEHVEDWLQGAVDDLRPSGPWPGYTPPMVTP